MERRRVRSLDAVTFRPAGGPEVCNGHRIVPFRPETRATQKTVCPNGGRTTRSTARVTGITVQPQVRAADAVEAHRSHPARAARRVPGGQAEPDPAAGGAACASSVRDGHGPVSSAYNAGPAG
ncbi:hypothetical protein ABZ801_20195 [Actinomadura sp. NPDC047616]|uniref:hypothetical protein n=1 Tax=Actinomadura sp. NPDC047616 TaxID=3155914 RepID=UPI0033C32EDF